MPRLHKTMILNAILWCFLLQPPVSASPNSMFYDSEGSLDSLTTRFKLKKNIFFHQTYSLKKDHHFLKPQEAMSLEVDSALIGFMSGTGASMSAMSSVASMFALGSCILGILNIYQSLKDVGDAKVLHKKIRSKIRSLKKELHSKHAENSQLQELQQNLIFYQELEQKISHYMKSEKDSLKINSLIATGTFSEFIGFMASHHMFGSDKVFPALGSVSSYFLSGGLIIVSGTSLYEAGKEVKDLYKINTWKIPGFKNDVVLIPEKVHELFSKEELNIRANLIHFKGDDQKPLNLDMLMTDLYQKEIKNRVKKVTHYRLLKASSRALIGAGTGFLAGHQIAHIAGATLLTSAGLTATGIGTGVGVALGLLGFIYFLKHIKSSPAVDMPGLDVSHLNLVREEILRIILKLNLKQPTKHSSFEEKFEYFVKMAPIDNFKKLKDLSAHPLIPTVSMYRSHEDAAMKTISKLYLKGHLNKITKPIVRDLFPRKNIQEFSLWEPFVKMNHKNKRGTIYWKSLVKYCFKHHNKNASLFFENFVNRGIKKEKELLKNDLKLTIDHFVKLIHKKQKRMA